ncbi:hypothetical protein AcW1_000501 [Taiwanofungus camphoratus]|nr:hypothetical protein AcW1_000501 [Antrodia cinnamomea]
MAQRSADAHDESDDASDMQMSQSDADQIDMDVDVDDEAPPPDAHDEEGPPSDKDVDVDVDVDVEDDDDVAEAASEPDALSSPPPEQHEPEPEPAPVQPRLKIKLRLPPQASSASSVVPTPDDAHLSLRRGASRDDYIESEDSEDEDGAQSTRSTSVATTGTAGRPLTARQAVLANVVDSSHVSLAEPPNPRKKKPLTEIEIALKREETARKRRNLTEKKLEDEKAETINRLLKKQSRAKGKRNALSTADDRPAPLASASNAVEAEAEDGADASAAPAPPVATMYRWISSTRAGPGKADGGEGEKMVLSFSVPAAALSDARETGSRPAEMQTEGTGNQGQGKESVQPRCDVQGCSERRKYRLVKDWRRGACNMGHLKVLEAQSG